MNDPRFRGAGAPSSSRQSRHDVERGVEDGLELIRGAIRELLARPKEERAAHLAALKLHLLTLIPKVEGADKNAPAARRLRAMERVLATLDEVSSRT